MKFKILGEFLCLLYDSIFIKSIDHKYLICSSWSKKVIEKTFKYEFLQITHPKFQMLRSQKSNFSEISTFSKLNIWMSYSKDEFLSVRTHPFDVNWPFSTFGDDLLNIYGLWKKSWNFNFWKNFFPNFKFSILK